MKHRRPQIDDRIPAALQERAIALMTAQGHAVRGWYSVKQTWGKAATQARCSMCSRTVIVMPRGLKGETDPMITGDGLARGCKEAR